MTVATGVNDGEKISLLAMASVLLRWRRAILFLGVLGSVAGLSAGLLSSRAYRSSAVFLPQVPEGNQPGLALMASQFGIRIPNTSGGWAPAVYVELLRSRALLESIARDTVEVAEDGGRRIALMDLLLVDAPTPGLRVERTVQRLRRKIVKSRDVRTLGAVEVNVTTKWPSVSLALAERLVRGVNQFNVETRKSQAATERQFVEARAEEAERALRDAEDRMQRFLQRNRVVSSPQLTFEHDRLQRDVALRQQVYTSLLQNREEARIREVRDTPVITVLEEPRLAVVSEPRRSVLKALLSGLAGALLGAMIAFLSEAVAGARPVAGGDAREFLELMEEVTPRFLRRGRH